MKNLLTFLLIFSLIGYAGAQKKNDPAPLGKLIDAGGHKLHVRIMGKGGPTVVMESGSFDFSFIWSLVQPTISEFTQTVSYDRAGFAWSEAGPLPRTGQQLAYELHTALQNAGVHGPYILVGQSFGGFLVRNYARLYPGEVAGMVLVDAIHEDQRINMGNKVARIRETAQGKQAPSVIKKSNRSQTDQTDSVIMNSQIEPPMDKLPKDIQTLQSWAQCQLRYVHAGSAEMEWSPEDVAAMYNNAGKKEYLLGDIPLIVICRGDGGYGKSEDGIKLENERLRLQGELTRLSTNSKLIIDNKSGHNIHLEDPETVIDAIKEVVQAAKNHTKLPNGDIKKFNLDDLISQSVEKRTDWNKFLDTETVFAGIYMLKAGQEDTQPVHEFDEVYYVVKGLSDFQAGDKKLIASPGKILYVPASVDHKFINIKEDLQLLVLFSRGTKRTETQGEEFDLKQLQTAGKSNENKWNPFLRKPTMVFGLYQLPKTLGGDSTLVHKWDEINIVTRGSGKFSVEDKAMDVSVNDIIFVKRGLGHYFHSLTSDFDVMILFERKSVER